MKGQIAHNFVDLSGMKFNFLTVIKRIENSNAGKAKYLCQCDCKRYSKVISSALKNGSTKTCGECDLIDRGARTHGMSKSYTYQSWTAMKRRCYDKNFEKYPRYGGRGIKVCDRWHKFENFLADMGERPEGKTIDRQDSNGNYDKKNCKWATAKEQSNNKTNKVHWLNRKRDENGRFNSVVE